MSDFKEMVFRLDPYKREEQGAIVEKHLQKLGYVSDETWNETQRLEKHSIYISTYCDGMYYYYVYDCSAKSFEPIPDEMSYFEERPKGVIGQWYTLTSDFDGEGVAKYKEAGYTWQCEEVDGLKEPKIDGIVINFDESYRLATPEEIERAKRQQGDQETDQGDQEEDEFIQISFVENQDKYDYINPDHYKQGSKEVIDMMINVWGRDVVAIYCEINAFKYRMRLGNKPEQPIERDLQKAQWYENKSKELRR